MYNWWSIEYPIVELILINNLQTLEGNWISIKPVEIATIESKNDNQHVCLRMKSGKCVNIRMTYQNFIKMLEKFNKNDQK